MKPAAPSEIAAKNIATLLRNREMSHNRLAQRMNTLGYGWYRKTVARVIAGERRLYVDEVYGLALALETTATAIIAPIDQAEMGRTGSTPRVGVGVMKTIRAEAARSLFDEDPNDLERIPSVRVLWDSDEEVPRWQYTGHLGFEAFLDTVRDILDSEGIDVPEEATESEVLELFNALTERRRTDAT